MTQKQNSAWQDRAVALKFLDERRAAIPFAAEQVDVMFRLIRHFLPKPIRIVDLGCGDGFLARTLLAEYPAASATLIDNSLPMLERARQAMAADAHRCEIIQGDLGAPLKQIGISAPAPDLVVSAFAIHHLPHERKPALYSEIFAALAPGGLFINIEHVASATPEIEAIYDAAYIHAISARTGKEFALVEAEYHNRPDKADNILEGVDVQLRWLREIGYRQVDCYFKWFELAVFGGIKA